MATSLKITSTDANLDTVTTNIGYINESCADSDLKLFATNLFNLSDNTLTQIDKITSTDISNVQPEPTGTYALWTPSAEFYDINNVDFMNIIANENRVLADDPEGIKAINSVTVNGNYIKFNCTLNDDSTDTKSKSKCPVFNQKQGRFAVTVEDEIQWVAIPSNPSYSVIAQALGISISDIAEMIQQNKIVQMYAQYVSAVMTNYSGARQSVSYVPATNSIRVDPVEGVTDNFGLYLNYVAEFYIWDYTQDDEVVDTNYYEGKVLGQNVTIILDNELGIFAGLES